MASLSALAETIIDFARSEAKRSSNEKVSQLHLLSAVRRWQEENFDTRFPGLSTRLRSALNASAGTALKVDGFEDSVLQQIEVIQNPSELWDLADTLSKKVPEVATEKVAERKMATAAESSSPPVSDGVVPSSTDDPLPFSITSGLIERVATALSIPIDSMREQILGASFAVATHVLNTPPANLSEMICTAAEVPFIDLSHATEIPLLITSITESKIPEAGRLATQVAVALVETAEWAAAIDQDITQIETDRIDELRLRFRDELGTSIDVTTEAMTRFEEKFSQLVGMQTVKAEIRKRVDYLVVNKRRAARGMKTGDHRMHSAFVGHPGTGKTTVARLYGELLNELGLLATKTFIETDRSGLVGRYIGETEEKTSKVIESAHGGVLFIDEAYALADHYGEQKGFGEEATDCLVKKMEDKRGNLVVILAGYKQQTLEFMDINPGLKSRVPAIIDFPDYSIDELVEIAQRIVARRSLTLNSVALTSLRTTLESEAKKTGFGNARTVENILEAAERNAVTRTSALGVLATEKELRTITSEDVPTTGDLASSEQKKNTIGFL